MRLLLVLFLVPLSICNANTKFPLSQAAIDSVFGNLPQAAAPAIPPVHPVQNGTVEVEYLDANQYVPSLADYDTFDWSLTKRIATSSDGNFLVSPLGLKLALAILTEAASGTTQKELTSVLGFEENTHIVRQKFARILDSLQTKSSHYTMDLGSRIYIGTGVEPQQRYAAIAKDFYRTEVINQDFRDPVAASEAINQWVSNNTHGRIPQLVDIDDVSGVVALVLNTLFFKGTWTHQFYPNDTRQDFFYVSGKVKKPTAFMSVKNKFYYADSAKFNAKILRMPYLGNKFAMYIVVPNSISGLSHVFNDASSLRNELFFLQESVVDVVLPKFQFEYTSLLDGLLKELGIRQAFEDSASFPGIARGQALTQKLKISKVLQRSGIEVNELGSVAYSATEIALENKFGGDMDSVPEVIANKPFFFFIQDEGTRQLLFTGRVADPTLFDGAYKLS